MKKIDVAIIGPGNIGTDLMYKIMKSNYLNIKHMAGVAESDGILRARELGVKTSITGIDDVLNDDSVKIVFEATSASVHHKHAPLLKEANKIVIDLTPAAIGPYVCPAVDRDLINTEDNLNMITCGGQATVPMVKAVSQIVPVKYAEIVSSVASQAAGPGTRDNIDEFTETTANGLVKNGGAKAGKAIIILNPAQPPIIMKNTIYCEVGEISADEVEKIIKSVYEMVEVMQSYVPGYKLRVPPIYEDDRITIIIEVEGAGDFLPEYAGNLDIINAAAISVAEQIANKMLEENS